MKPLESQGTLQSSMGLAVILQIIGTANGILQCLYFIFYIAFLLPCSHLVRVVAEEIQKLRFLNCCIDILFQPAKVNSP